MTDPTSCVFCDIVAGSAPATVLEDGPHSLIIVPLGPVTDGHVLVIPREHVADAATDPEVTARTMADAAGWAEHRGRPFNLITSAGRPATQSVFHLHVHYVPRTADDQLMVPWGTLHGEDPQAPHRCRRTVALENELDLTRRELELRARQLVLAHHDLQAAQNELLTRPPAGARSRPPVPATSGPCCAATSASLRPATAGAVPGPGTGTPSTGGTSSRCWPPPVSRRPAVADVWFTSDTHFGHRAMIDRGWRPQYASVADMNADLIDRWNTSVRPADTVWHLGDWGLGPAAEHLAILARLHGTIHLVTGNHDKPWPGNRDAHKHQAAWIRAGFASVQAFARRRIAGQQVLLSHFPYEGDHTGQDRADQYRLRDLGLPLLHGHVHDEWRIRGRQLNVGVDVHDFRPVHLDEVAHLLELAPGLA
jgi:calcineurin-like phosphoesterase family protein/diadenosine tetraphosphate (Ap4A) HIT family hydrolase